MESSGGLHPALASRFAALSARWNAFAVHGELRLLRWVVPSQDAALVGAFFEYQNTDEGDTPDLFVPLDAPFTAEDARSERGPQSYGRRLARELEAQFNENREALAAAGVPASWFAPPIRVGEPDTACLARCCVSFANYFSDSVERVVLVLQPTSVSDGAAWGSWLLALLPLLPVTVRVLVVDDAQHSLLPGIEARDGARARSEAPGVELPTVAMALASEGAGDTAASAFTRAFLALASAVSAGHPLDAHRHANAALSIARAKHWADMEACVHMAFGSAQTGWNDHPAATRSFHQAVACASSGGDRGSAAVLPAMFAEAGALLSQQKLADASVAYHRAAALALERTDYRMAVEGFRLAAHCCARLGEAAKAWETGWSALDAGARMERAERPQSTLSRAGEDLLDVARARRLGSREHGRVEERMVALLGDPWRTSAAAS